MTIVSHRLQMAFIKTRKVGGTSVEVALSPYCGPDDMLTPLVPEDESVRREMGASAQNYQIPLSRMTPLKVASWVKRRERPPVAQHEPVRRVRHIVGRDTWAAYFSFSIERNPWDRAVSFYFWRRHRDGIEVGFSRWLRIAYRRRLLSNWPLYAIGSSIAVDHVILFEQLRDEFPMIADKIGVPTGDLPRLKTAMRPKRAKDYRSFYSDGDAELVAKACEREIAAFGYSFDGAGH